MAQHKLSVLEKKLLESLDDPPDPIQEGLECAVCLQTCVHPVQLNCKHIFCFLCVKGVALQSKKCPMCRREIPLHYLENPKLVEPLEGTKCAPSLHPPRGQEKSFCWFYEGRNGWWRYDQRTSSELEAHYKKGDSTCELLIAGFLYTVDFRGMQQFRRNEPTRRRGIKRDVSTVPTKGIAGLRMASALPASTTCPVGTSTTTTTTTTSLLPTANTAGTTVTTRTSPSTRSNIGDSASLTVEASTASPLLLMPTTTSTSRTAGVPVVTNALSHSSNNTSPIGTLQDLMARHLTLLDNSEGEDLSDT